MHRHNDSTIFLEFTLVSHLFGSNYTLSQTNIFCIFGYSQKGQYMMEKTKHTFDQAEIELLKEGLKRTYKERFEMATRLYKVQQTMKKASITHKPFISK